MTIEKVMEFWRRQPFAPFDLRVSFWLAPEAQDDSPTARDALE